jgi:flagellar biosynthetic protein FliO
LLAFEESAPVTVESVQTGVSPFSVLRILIVLVLVACAIYGLVFLLRKMGGRQNAESGAWLKVLASTPVGARNNAAVVAVGSQAWLVGTSDSGMALIAEITDKETVDAMLLEQSVREANAAARPRRFEDMLRRFMPEAAKQPFTKPNLKIDRLAAVKARMEAG